MLFAKLQHLFEDIDKIERENEMLQKLKLANEKAKVYQEKVKKSGKDVHINIHNKL